MKIKKQKDEVVVSFSDLGLAYVISKDGTISVRELIIDNKGKEYYENGDEDGEGVEDFELLSLSWNEEENRFDLHHGGTDILVS